MTTPTHPKPKKLTAEALGHWLKGVRLHLCMNQVDFAAAVGVAQSHLSRMEDGFLLPGYSTTRRLIRGIARVTNQDHLLIAKELLQL